MRDLEHVNEYQQLLLSALALVHEEDLVAIFRAARNHEVRSKPIELMNVELDKGLNLMQALDAPSSLHALFEVDYPSFTVQVGSTMVLLSFGTHGPPSELHVWRATMASTGVVESLEHEYQYYSEGPPESVTIEEAELLVRMRAAKKGKGYQNWN